MAKKKDMTSQREVIHQVAEHITSARDALYPRRDVAKAMAHLRLAKELLELPLFAKEIHVTDPEPTAAEKAAWNV